MLTQDQFNYVRRTLRHIHWVQEYAFVLAQSEAFDENTSKTLLERAAMHDSSKFKNEEWDAYQRYWTELDDVGRRDPEETETFEKAWQHHLSNSPHHPEHWDHSHSGMPDWAVLEMVCDWAAMSTELTGGDECKYKTELSQWATDAIPRMGLKPYHETICAAVSVIISYWERRF